MRGVACKGLSPITVRFGCNAGIANLVGGSAWRVIDSRVLSHKVEA
jgi:hypothetical protein